MKTQRNVVLVSIFTALAVLGLLFVGCDNLNGSDTTETVATPTANPPSGTSNTVSFTVTLSCTTQGASIYYTINGGTPTASSLLYTEAITISSTGTLRAIAVKEGMNNSGILTAAYTIGNPQWQTVATPTATPEGGNYTTVQTVTLETATPEADIHYTLDGNTPTADSTPYSALTPIVISTTTTLKAIAVKDGMNNSEVLTAVYTIGNPDWETVATPTADPEGGTYNQAQTVTLSCATSGASIHYTTNGGTPSASSTLYVGAISITQTTTIKAIAVKEGMNDSDPLIETYTINKPYTVTFETWEGSEVPSQSVYRGNRASEPEAPTNGFYNFDGWFTDPECTKVYYFYTPVTEDITLYAGWDIYIGSNRFIDWLQAQSGGNSPDDPFPVVLKYTKRFNDVLYAISHDRNDMPVNKYITLDFSACPTSSDGSIGGWLWANRAGMDKVVSIILPDSATSIYANGGTFTSSTLRSISGKSLETLYSGIFRNCTALTSVDFPNLVTIYMPTYESVYSYGVFEGCTALEEIYLPKLKTTGDKTFRSCTGLVSINLPEAITIGYEAFVRCTSLETVNAPHVTSIGEEAFVNCISLTDLNLPEVKSIGIKAFAKWNASDFPDLLISVNLPMATEIGEYAFAFRTALASVSLPATAVTDNNPFAGCTSLDSFILSGTGQLSTIEDGKALVKNDIELVAYPTASGNIEISGITVIGKDACYECTSLTSVSFPDVITISESAFSFCGYTINNVLSDGLANVYFPNATHIGKAAFYCCPNLSSIEIPSIVSIGDEAFQTISHNVTIKMGNNAPTVGAQAIRGYTTVYSSPTQYVTVKVPLGASGYGTIPATCSGSNSDNNWANAFRGKGWDGTNYGIGYGYVDSSVNLSIVYE